MTTMQVRPATVEEVRRNVGHRIGFYHFVRELSAPRARNGVQHKSRSTSTLKEKDGKFYVLHQGRAEEVEGRAILLDGKFITVMFKIASPYLPWTI